MTKYNRYLISFMKAKARKLKPLTSIPYFTKADAKAIEKWSNAKAIWNKLCYSIRVESNNGLFDTLCPFCIRYGLDCHNCKHCEYGAVHGLCGKDDCDDDFSKILVNAFDNCTWHTITVFTTDFYTKLIKRIEKSVK